VSRALETRVGIGDVIGQEVRRQLLGGDGGIGKQPVGKGLEACSRAICALVRRLGL
jgi:hypothetical protein